ncbi:hypothetical protein NDU88_006079 [Pleurodeles waltl]|uniref:Uncharacterized protein n=1 Tax=Pleurodeles waltl TaxID=8319 RepID=A0AAV7LQW0_PLEWA|nr:hypothetical protein NDU88_006079 [Pleurodeles waltl]
MFMTQPVCRHPLRCGSYSYLLFQSTQFNAFTLYRIEDEPHFLLELERLEEFPRSAAATELSSSQKKEETATGQILREGQSLQANKITLWSKAPPAINFVIFTSFLWIQIQDFLKSFEENA